MGRRGCASARPRTPGRSTLVDGPAAQISDLDEDMQVPGPLTQEARPHHDQAVLSYGEARAPLEKPAAGVADVNAADEALEKRRGTKPGRR